MKNSKKIIWTIFKIERSRNRGYKAKTSIDQAWLMKQSKRISSEVENVTLILADLFAELVYGCNLSDLRRASFLRKLNMKLRKFKNFDDVFSESEIVEKIWSKKKFLDQFNKEKAFIKRISKSELNLRKTMYNPKNFKISKSELYDIALKASAALNTEKVLTNLLINYNDLYEKQ